MKFISIIKNISCSISMRINCALFFKNSNKFIISPKKNIRTIYSSTPLFIGLLLFFLSCNEQPNIKNENINIQRDTIQSESFFNEKKVAIIQNGDYIKYYKNGVIEMQGTMKGGNRFGVWKSSYGNGSPWSETTFIDGKKNGETTSWYENGNKRYVGFYKNDVEYGTWTFWAENGDLLNTRNY